jgi:hypothetical protein
MTAHFYNGATLVGSITRSVDGDGGAVLFAASTDGSTAFTSVVFSAEAGSNGFALANLRYSLAPTIAKAFSPATIQSGGTSTVTVTITNPDGTALTGGAFTDTLTNMSAAGGAVGGTCVGTTPATLTAGQIALAFTGITIPASGSCTVTFNVTSSTAGTQSNTTSGVTTAQTSPAGTASNTANLTVLSAPTISKAFSPATIQSGGTSAVTVTITNPDGTARTGGAFTDTLTNMSAAGGAVGGTCVGTTPATLTAGQTALAFTGITIPAGGSCTVSFGVTSSTPGVRANVTSGITTTQTPTAGAASNTANLTVDVVPIPTLSNHALILLAAMLAFGALFVLRGHQG